VVVGVSRSTRSLVGALLRRQAGSLAVVVLLSIGLAASLMAGQWLYRSIFDVLLPTRDPGLLVHALIVIGWVAAGSLLTNVGISFLTRSFRSRFARDLRAVALDRTLDMPYRHLVEQTPGVTFQRLIPDVDSLSLTVGHLVTAAAHAIQLAVILSVIGWVDPRVALVSAGMMAAFLLAGVLVAPALHASLARRNVWTERRGALSLSVLPSVKDIKCLDLQQRFLDEHARLSRDALPDVLASVFWESFSTVGSGIPARMGALGVFAVGFAAVASGRYTPGMVMTLVANAGALIWPLSCLFRALTSARIEWPAGERAVRHLETALEPSGSRVLGEVRAGIRVTGLRFAYPAAPWPVLDDVTVEFPAGSFTAVVGVSGSGKTTLLDVLMKIHPCARGSVSIDGIDLCDLDNASLRRHVAYVSQEPLLFAETLRSNIDPHGRLQAAELRRLCSALLLDGLVDGHPAGLDTLVAENGTNLSGGERQRVGIARGLARGARVLVLDEATAALDPGVERRILQVLRDWMSAHQGTVIAVTHSQAVARAADRVVRLGAGRLIEEPAPRASERTG
jgi:ABC-type bacteriocin/lantibiotic exporter with double-glycine peptidase domain